MRGQLFPQKTYFEPPIIASLIHYAVFLLNFCLPFYPIDVESLLADIRSSWGCQCTLQSHTSHFFREGHCKSAEFLEYTVSPTVYRGNGAKKKLAGTCRKKKKSPRQCADPATSGEAVHSLDKCGGVCFVDFVCFLLVLTAP